MKSTHLSSIVLAIIISTRISVAQPGWFPQVSGTVQNLNAIAPAFVPGRFFAVGDSGTILLKSDQGQTWSSIPTNTTASLNAIGFSNPDTGFAVGDGGVMLKVTLSGGYGLGTGTGRNLHGVAAVPDPLNRAVFAVGDSGTILRTIDRGATWTISHSGTLNLRAITFLGFNAIYIVGDSGTVLKSINAGNVWSPKILPTQFSGLNFYSVTASSQTVRIAGENGTILASLDGGNTWQQETSHVSETLRSLFIAPPYSTQLQPGQGWVVGDNGIILTAGTSLTWSQQGSGVTDKLFGVLFDDSLTGIAVGANGTILRTLTGGSSLPRAFIPSTTLSFGPVTIGSSKTAILTVTNQGLTQLHVSSVSSSSGEFDVAPPSALVDPLTGQDFAITFHPLSKGTKISTLSFEHNGSGPHAVLAGGEGIDPIVSSGWAWQNPLPQGNFLYGVTCVHTDTVIAVGELGTMLVTVNAGASWGVQHYAGGTTNTLNAVSFVNGSIGTAVGNYGTILHTVDGGRHWLDQASGTFAYLTGISALDANTSVAVGTDHYSLTPGVILRTSDGGSHWTARLNVEHPLYGVAFGNAHLGLAVGDASHLSGVYIPAGFILRTTDAGKNWVGKEVGPSPLFGVSFSDSNSAIAVGQNGAIAQTTDGGLTWTTRSVVAGTLRSVSMAASGVGTAVGAYGTGGVILRTGDGGYSWDDYSAQAPRRWLNSVCMTNGATAFSVGNSFFPPAGGEIIESYDFGRTWTENSTAATTRHLRSISSPDDLISIVTGDSGTILRTTDGGAHWARQLQGTLFEKLGLTLSSCLFYDAMTGIVAGAAGSIITTTDGGGSWSSRSTGTTNFLYGIGSAFPGTAYVVGYGGTILRTTDWGSTWVDQSPGLARSLFAIAALDSNEAVAVGEVGTIELTLDAGKNWFTVPSGTSSHLYGVSFNKSRIGVAVGSTGAILRTTDGGLHWLSQSNVTENSLYGVLLIGADRGVIVGGRGTILVSTDAGAHWRTEGCGAAANLFSVAFSGGNNLTIAGSGGAIVHTSNGGVLFVDDDLNGHMPGAYALEQNYPNPFNPVTAIRYEIPAPQRNASDFSTGRGSPSRGVYVSLKLYDVLGREIATLVSGVKQPGVYHVEWDGGRFPSGVYLYRLFAGTFSDVKKMILIR